MTLADLKKLSNVQRKRLLLTLILGLGAVYAVVNFMISPVIDGHRRAVAELADLQDRLSRAQQAISHEEQTREELETTKRRLQNAAAQHIPPVENPLSWVAGRVYGSARSVGVDIESVADLGVPTLPWSRDKDVRRVFTPYRARIVTQCGYHELVQLIRALEEENPYLCVSEIQVTGRESDFDQHDVRISVEWPAWMEPGQAQELNVGEGA